MHAGAQGDSPKRRHACILILVIDADWALVWAKYLERFTTGMTQSQIGDLAGVNQTTVGRWLKGQVAPDVQVVVRVARKLNRNPLEALVAAGCLSVAEARRGLSSEEYAEVERLVVAADHAETYGAPVSRAQMMQRLAVGAEVGRPLTEQDRRIILELAASLTAEVGGTPSGAIGALDETSDDEHEASATEPDEADREPTEGRGNVERE